jgi:hypothetical protein
MRSFVAFCTAAVLFLVAYEAEAQQTGTTASRIRLVQAQCTTGPCTPGFAFKRGDVNLRRVKNPKPVGDRRFGKVSIGSLDVGLGVFPTTMEAQISGRRVWGTDPDGDCPQANSESTGLFGTSLMTCTLAAFNLGRCRGDLFFTTLLDPRCSDVRQTFQDIQVGVYEAGFAGDPTHLIATAGVAILGKMPDCNSGGSGCP